MVPAGSKNTIAVLGYDPPLIRESVARGLRTIMVRDVRAHLRGGAIPLPPSIEEIVVEDITDIGDVLGGLTRLLGGAIHGELRGIVTFDEFAVSTAAALCSLMGLPGIAPERAILMRDKHLQKQAVRNAGIPAAASRVVVPGSHLIDVRFPGPCVVKPLSGGGAIHTEAVRTEAEYDALLKRLTAAATSPFVVEDLVDVREEWIVDGVVQDGAVVFSSVGRYGEPCMSFALDAKPLRMYRMDHSGEDARCAEARSIAGRALQALGFRDGVFHMELLLDAGTDTMFFGECAGRIGGALIQEAVLLKHGFSLAGAGVDLAIGAKVSTPGVTSDVYVGAASLHLPRGTVVKLPDRDWFAAQDFIHEFRVSALLGLNDGPDTPSALHRQGMCLVSGDSLEEVDLRLSEVQHRFVAQSLIAPTFGTGVQQREFMADYEDTWRKRA